MLVNICMKFHEDTLNGIKVQSGRDFVLETAGYKVQTGITQKSINTRVTVLAFCTSSYVG